MQEAGTTKEARHSPSARSAAAAGAPSSPGDRLADAAALLFAGHPDGRVLVDARGVVLACNEAAEALLGDALASGPVHACPGPCGIHLGNESAVCDADRLPIVRALRGATVRDEILHVRNARVPEGRWIAADAHPVLDDDDTLRGAIWTLRDVTRRRRVEEVLSEERRLLEVQVRRHSAISEVELAINQPHELQGVLDQVVALTERLLPASAVGIVLRDESTGDFRVSASTVSPAMLPTFAERVRRGEGATWWILEHGRPLAVSDLSEDPFGADRALAKFGMQAYAGVPLRDEGAVVGVLYALHREPRQYSQDDLDFMTALASRAATATARVRFYERLQRLNDVLHRTSAELRENELRFRTLADTAPVLIWMSGTDKGCTYFNKMRLDFTGRTIEQERSDGWMDVVHPEDLQRVLHTYRASFDRRVAFTMEYRLRRADGRWRWLLDTGTPRSTDDGEFLGYIGSCIDITDRKVAEAELARHQEQLETLVEARTAELRSSHEQLRAADRLATIGTLTAGLGHDINNVLFPIRCRLEALRWDEIPTDLKETLQAVAHTAEYLQQLSDGLRLFARDPDAETMTAEATHLPHWWRQVSGLLTKTLPERVRLACDFDDDLPPLQVAPHRLTQAILNLVVNAGEAMPDGGPIRVWARAADGNRHVRVGVTDEGQGMSPEVKRRAFDPFFTTKTRRLSTGLGLSLVHGVVKSSRGTVDVETEPGRGTTFLLTFPAAGDARAVPAPAAPEPLGTAVVGLSDPRLAAWTRGCLRAEGYRVEAGARAEDDDALLWVTESAKGRRAAAQRFLERRPGRRVIVFGEDADRWDDVHGVVVRPPSNLKSMREAIERVSRAHARGDR